MTKKLFTSRLQEERLFGCHLPLVLVLVLVPGRGYARPDLTGRVTGTTPEDDVKSRHQNKRTSLMQPCNHHNAHKSITDFILLKRI